MGLRSRLRSVVLRLSKRAPSPRCTLSRSNDQLLSTGAGRDSRCICFSKYLSIIDFGGGQGVTARTVLSTFSYANAAQAAERLLVSIGYHSTGYGSQSMSA